MSFELAGNPKKMLAGYLNKADLGEVTGEGIRQGVMNDISTHANNIFANDTVSRIQAMEEASALEQQLAEAQMEAELGVDALQTGLGAATTIGGSLMKANDFSLFDKGPDLSDVDVDSSIFRSAKDEADSYFGSRI